MAHDNEVITDEPTTHEVYRIDADDYINEMCDDGPLTSAVESEPGSPDTEAVLLAKKNLSRLPKGYKRGAPKESLSALTEAQLKRAEAMQSKIKLENDRLDFDNRWKVREYELKEMELEFKKEQLVFDQKMRLLEIEKEERMEKFKIEQEMKLQIDLAKLKNYTNPC